ncbi:MAG TPA: metalloprotease family protein [Lacunisphaera sp.]|nr:metalloprotease family protein [Lacunisphaera sp.]
MIIPGFIITWLTFPGVIVHELAHKLFCHWTGTKVVEVCYFRFGNPAGYVVHEIPTNIWKHILIGVGPLFVNTILGFLIGLLLLPLQHLAYGDMSSFLKFAIGWLAVSVAMHSFPSTGDAKGIWAAIWDKGAPVSAKLVGTPLVGLIFLGAIGSVVWLDLIYGLGVVVGLPKLLHLG